MKSLIILCLTLVGSVNAVEVNVNVEQTNQFIRCTTRTYFERRFPGPQCLYEEVMVGIDSFEPLYIRCAKVDVQCTSTINGTKEEGEKKD